ncbi:MAG: exodeoxyribonuclease VII small subunit [Chloroflexaceae bacterium]|nr:exodeoxyribonuclease VII small subunit [Chloroflexaceae bacterium]
MSTNANDTTETYETLYQRLSEVVSQLETGSLSLEASLQLYEQGMNLATTCQRLLDQAELRVQQVQSGTLEPFEPGAR